MGIEVNFLIELIHKCIGYSLLYLTWRIFLKDYFNKFFPPELRV
jgi:hypothetical protein